MHSTWAARIGIVALVAVMCLADYGLLITPAAAAPPVKEGALEGVTQNWDKVLPAAQRFVVLGAFSNEAVRDNETGLVWEKEPGATSMNWSSARGTCADKKVGGRKGWRLPSFPELASLVDTSLASGPALPTGHPFINVQPTYYWSATTGAENTGGAWAVTFDVAGSVLQQGKTALFLDWCVRGPMNADQY